jgi:ribonucleoside-triphosphate reductase
MHDEEFGVKVKSIFDNITASQAKDSDLKRDNANINGDTAMGAMLQYGANTAKEYNLNWLIDPEIARLHKEGWIHIHDLDFYAWTTTCTQIELRKLFKGGFNTGHGHLREPKGIGSYAALAAIAIQSNQNDQHGGQSIVDFDYAMGDGVRITYQRYLKEAFQLQADLGGKTDIPWREQYALKKTTRDTYQAMEGLIHNLNTMHSRAGAQVPFSSINYGTDTSWEGRLVIEQLLLATKAGLGNGETPIFPIQIFRVKEGVNYNPSDPNYDLFRLAMETSAKRLFPNFAFLDAPYNLQYYKPGHPETEVAYMGCRTRVMGNVNGEEVAPGRGNLSFTSINLPRLAIEAKGSVDKFCDLLDGMLKATLNQLLARLEIQSHRKARNFPFLMGEHV